MSLEAFSDEALLALVARGEEAALQQLFRRYAGAFLGLARRMGLDSASGEDVVQEAFSKVWQNANAFDPRRASARAWLLAIAHHTAVDHIRRLEARPKPLEDEEAEAFDLPGAGLDEEGQLNRIRLKQALAQLSEEEREVIEVLFYQGYAHQEAALKLGLPLGTLKTRARRALARLKGVLREA
ncbi:MAG: sigma-70 family RNA polymerase sigma factor [Meiothermus sp.]|uniref:sigma-70 family RNA polymerase sigma factor n=2 Tax=Meiothermus sp. TaxID=1955249 RepID=UPI0025FDC49E|nr:sigma-70 family RNA polymerase sigma factor [Meiothermus sp.]MCS7194030.1 sigma-70 family RNA polymerase sigma factor [Meiothermus sp.]MCX7601977.1 sigma-70 family RNA polymerase sigma factor [Meiothermus sp.]MDW8090238.1 sigma-70 family RNA polymerase sigma factor [Meiothermus sp.]MDW8481205.1 sigma-70 family RNA polymerase sigma factor [Meiothermus sp.]